MENVALPELFEEINEKLGNALEPMISDDRVVGRERELIRLSIIMERLENQVALLLGPAGAGKSALAAAWKNREEEKSKTIEVFKLHIGRLGGDSKNLLMKRMDNLLYHMKDYKDALKEKVPDAELVLFIDEVHTVVSVFGENSKIGGDLLKESLARADKFVKVIAATTNDEYESYIAQDKPLARRFKNVTINEVPQAVTHSILKNWLKKHSNPQVDLTEKVSDDMLWQIITANRIYREGFFEPAKSIDVLDTLLAMHKVTNEPIDRNLLGEVLESQFNIDLNFNVDPKEVMKIIKSQILGQPVAIHTIKTTVERIAFQLYRNQSTPRATMMFPGTTGTGKAIANDELVPVYIDGKTQFKPHGDIVPNDYVYNRHGRPIRVTDVFPQGQKRAYKVTFSNNSSVVCNDQHLWTYRDIDGKWHTDELEVLIQNGIYQNNDTSSYKYVVPKYDDTSMVDLNDLDGSGTLAIKSIEDLGYDVEMKCIMVDDEEHLYCVTENYIVTHNTQMAKALCEGVTGDPKNLRIISMTDYSHKGGEVQFNRVVGKAAKENPRSFLLLDELEKATKEVRNAMLPILDEGMVTYFEYGADGRLVEQKVSLKNTVIIATTNAGAKNLNELNKYMEKEFKGEDVTQQMLQDARSIDKTVHNALAAEDDFSPEFLARFDSVVPFLTLNKETLLRIAHMQLLKLVKQIYLSKGIIVHLPNDKDWSKSGSPYVADAISMYIVIERMDSEMDAGKNGAREIGKIINNEILSEIITAYYDNTDCKYFQLETNGQTRFEITDSASKEGFVRCVPLN